MASVSESEPLRLHQSVYVSDSTTTETCSCVSSTTATATMRRRHAARRSFSHAVEKVFQFPGLRLTLDLCLLQGGHAAGLKQEVVTALRTLRDKLLAEEKQKEVRRGENCSVKSEDGESVLCVRVCVCCSIWPAAALLPNGNIWRVGSCRTVQWNNSAI